MTGRVCLVTGASSGIGKAAALGLAERGARVVMVCRDSKRGERSRRWVAGRTGNDAVDLLLADLSSQREVRRLARNVTGRYSRLDVLLNNAGLLTKRRRTTVDGLEMQLAVNHLAYFLLTKLLLDLLRASAPSRIVNVASSAHTRGRIDFEDLESKREYDGWQVYSNTKLANILFTYELARRIEGSGVTANSLHPGVIHTGLMRNYSRLLQGLWDLVAVFFRNPREGAETPVYLASSPEVEGVSGRYFIRCGEARCKPHAYDRDAARRLWEVSERLTTGAGHLGAAAGD